jgi:hypothetical protein
MRILIELPKTDRAAFAAAADTAGVFGVVLRSGSGMETSRAAEVVLATTDARIVVEVMLGDEHPVTLAEEIAVLDNISAGRIVVLLETGTLDAPAAIEDVSLFALSLGSRPVRHIGERWRVPAGINPDVPGSLLVTPQPTQVQVPIWVTGASSEEVVSALSLPRFADLIDDSLTASPVQPATADLTGDLETDRRLVSAWAAAGATHLALVLQSGAYVSDLADYVARYLVPEVGMVDFPRLMADVTPPPAWPIAE